MSRAWSATTFLLGLIDAQAAVSKSPALVGLLADAALLQTWGVSCLFENSTSASRSLATICSAK